MGNSGRNRNAAIAAALLVLSVLKANGQSSSSLLCTPSMLNRMTPCINYITGGSGNGSSPTPSCCHSFKSVMNDSVDCACSIVTANVPISLPFNRTLALSLPQACSIQGSVPLQCQAVGVPLPAPGPVQFGSAQAPVSGFAFSPRASKAVVSTSTVETAPAASPTAAMAPVAHPGVRPVLIPASASGSFYISIPILLLLCLATLTFGL